MFVSSSFQQSAALALTSSDAHNATAPARDQLRKRVGAAMLTIWLHTTSRLRLTTSPLLTTKMLTSTQELQCTVHVAYFFCSFPKWMPIAVAGSYERMGGERRLKYPQSRRAQMEDYRYWPPTHFHERTFVAQSVMRGEHNTTHFLGRQKVASNWLRLAGQLSRNCGHQRSSARSTPTTPTFQTKETHISIWLCSRLSQIKDICSSR